MGGRLGKAEGGNTIGEAGQDLDVYSEENEKHCSILSKEMRFSEVHF